MGRLEFTDRGGGEQEFVLTDASVSRYTLASGETVESEQGILVHPWHRDGLGEVYLEISYFLPGTRKNVDVNALQNIIVNREQFVEGLLAVFPELSKKEAPND